MSQNNIPTTLPNIERLIQRVATAEKTQQKDIRITLQEGRDLSMELAMLTSRLGKTVTDIHKMLADIRESATNIDVKFDGGGFE
jgi:regulator of replication initiation timing